MEEAQGIMWTEIMRMKNPGTGGSIQFCYYSFVIQLCTIGYVITYYTLHNKLCNNRWIYEYMDNKLMELQNKF